MRIFDATDPTALRETGAFATNEAATDVAIQGSSLITALSDILVVFDVSQPAPVRLGGVWLGWFFELADGVVYAGGRKGWSLIVVDFGPEFLDTIQVSLDLNPGDPDNRVVITRPGTAVVGLLGSPELHAFDVALDSLRIGAGAAMPQTRFLYDWNDDGRLDASAIFRIQDAAIRITDEQICIRAETWTGTLLRGCDALQPLAGRGGGFATALCVPVLLPLGRGAARAWRQRRRDRSGRRRVAGSGD